MKSAGSYTKIFIHSYQQLFPFSALTLLVGPQERHLADIKLGVGLLVVTI